MAAKGKRALGIGCGLVLLVVVGIFGTATWYTGKVNRQYRKVTESEAALRAATERDMEFRPPGGGIPSPERTEVFLAVREDLADWRETMAAVSGRFAAERERQRTGGWRELLRLVNTGSDLMPVYAGFWVARNEALREHGMGPGEYAYIYRLVYRTWLEPDRPAVAGRGYATAALDTAFVPFHTRLVAVFDPQVDPVELIFQEEGN